MNTRRILIPVIIIAMLLASCNAIPIVGDRLITPSDVIITETRPVSGFDAIDFSTIGKIILSQGSTESFTISGSDNLVPLVKTSVSGGTLTIRTDEGIGVTKFNEDYLTLTITVKDLTSLDVSGLSDIQMASLSTPNLSVEMSGAGKIQLDQLSTDTLNIDVSGLGDVQIAGEAATVTIDISGAGSVNAPDLMVQNANVSVPGLGSATLWVTDKLTASISGAGSVSYYGNPQLDTNSSGLGNFKPLGNK
jgi:hypothetical protein